MPQLILVFAKIEVPPEQEWPASTCMKIRDTSRHP